MEPMPMNLEPKYSFSHCLAQLVRPRGAVMTTIAHLPESPGGAFISSF